MGLSLTPACLKDFIFSRELDRRRGSWGDGAETVIRRGLVVGSTILIEKVLPSGFARAGELIEAAAENGGSFPDGLVIVSEKLTSGRGRFRRAWHAPDGGLWLTVVIANTLLPDSARLLPLAVGVAVCETVREYVPEAALKWVNDIMIHGRKVAGVLIESRRCADEEFFLVGIGLNVNNRDFPAPLADTAVSLAQAVGGELDLDGVAYNLLAKLGWNVGLLCDLDETWSDHAANVHPLITRWRKLSDTVGRRVAFGHDLDHGIMYEAVAESIGTDGSLNLRLDDGTVVNEVAGELRYL